MKLKSTAPLEDFGLWPRTTFYVKITFSKNQEETIFKVTIQIMLSSYFRILRTFHFGKRSPFHIVSESIWLAKAAHTNVKVTKQYLVYYRINNNKI